MFYMILHDLVRSSILVHGFIYHDFMFNSNYIHISFNMFWSRDWGLGRKVAATLVTEVACLSSAVLQTYMHPFCLLPSRPQMGLGWGQAGAQAVRTRSVHTHVYIYIYIYKATWIFADLYGFLLIVNVFVWLLHDLPWFLMLGHDFIHDDSIFNLNYVRIYFRHFGTLDLERWQAPKRKPWPKQNSPEQGVHKGFRDLLVLLQSPVQMQWCQAPAHTPEPQRKWENIVRADIRITAWGHNTSFHMQGERMRYKTIELPHAMRQQYL